jgi:PhzF family phenazine biosynthesis protein
MNVRIFQIDAFTDKLFHGNPAAVCPLSDWLATEQMQQIAMENNQAETAFFVRGKDRHEIRWFTPAVEVDLCGHATLATAYVIFHFDSFPGSVIEFNSRSGLLTVRKDGDLLTLNFPADKLEKTPVPDDLIAGIGLEPIETYKGRDDYMLVYASAREIESLKPDMSLLARVPARGIIATAPGRDVDFVSRFFAPRVGIPEDPVTGSAHTTLAPFWAARLGKQELTAQQLSKRRGWLRCKVVDDRVEISGHARVYMAGQIHLVTENHND